MTKTIGQLESEIKALQDELKSVTGLDGLKKCSDFADIDKLTIFYSLHAYMYSLMSETVEDKRTPKDAKQYLFEYILPLFLGDGAWDIWRRYQR